MRKLLAFLLFSTLASAAAPAWVHDGQRWVYRADRSDLAEIIHDGTGWWTLDLRWNKPRVIGLSRSLEEAEQKAEGMVQ